MVDEFDLPSEIIDRKVTKMKMISPSNREVDVGKTLSETEYIGMCRREVRPLPPPSRPAPASSSQSQRRTLLSIFAIAAHYAIVPCFRHQCRATRFAHIAWSGPVRGSICSGQRLGEACGLRMSWH